jgi:hypothetical protein
MERGLPACDHLVDEVFGSTIHFDNPVELLEQSRRKLAGGALLL